MIITGQNVRFIDERTWIAIPYISTLYIISINHVFVELSCNINKLELTPFYGSRIGEAAHTLHWLTRRKCARQSRKLKHTLSFFFLKIRSSKFIGSKPYTSLTPAIDTAHPAEAHLVHSFVWLLSLLLLPRQCLTRSLWHLCHREHPETRASSL